MAELKQRLRGDFTSAMKAQDKLRTGTLRMLLAAVQHEEVSGKQARELADDEVLKVLAKEARKRAEAAEVYTQNGRGELAANEHAEARVIDEYLPTQLTEAEVADVADTAIAQVAEEIGAPSGDAPDGSGDEGRHRRRGGQGRRRATLGGGQSAPLRRDSRRLPGWTTRYPVRTTRFGYTLMRPSRTPPNASNRSPTSPARRSGSPSASAAATPPPSRLGFSWWDLGHQYRQRCDTRWKRCRKAEVTIAFTDERDMVVAPEGVYSPQEDSQLLLDVTDKTGLAVRNRVADLCTGSGVVAIGAALQGASSVAAFDICPRAVRCARANAAAAGAHVDVHLGSWARAVEYGPFDLIVSNPPYVPHDPAEDGAAGLPAQAGPPRAWNAGPVGRLVLDPLCAAAPTLLADGGTLLIVHSEFSGPRQSLAALAAAGLDAEIVAYQWIPFGPVLTARAEYLQVSGLLEPGRREEELVVIRADKP